MAHGKDARTHTSNTETSESVPKVIIQVIATTTWDDSTSPSDVIAIQQRFISEWVPVLAAATGEDDSGSYSNEANLLEPDYQTTFFGPNYSRLSSIKAEYDPNDLFIVGAGVGSERWDSSGMCTV